MEKSVVQKLANLCPSEPSLELCSSHNPALWLAWCNARKRSAEPSNVWTEQDVVTHVWSMCYYYPELSVAFGGE